MHLKEPCLSIAIPFQGNILILRKGYITLDKVIYCIRLAVCSYVPAS